MFIACLVDNGDLRTLAGFTNPELWSPCGLLLTGADCAGVVADCAVNMQHDAPALVPGDAMFGLARGSLGSHVVADAAALAHLPPAAELEQASAAPTVFTTAHLALCDVICAYEGRRRA